MGKTRDLFKKMRDTKVKFHAKMGSIKNRENLIRLPFSPAVSWSVTVPHLLNQLFCLPGFVIYDEL